MLTLIGYVLIIVYLAQKVNAFFDHSEQFEAVNKIKVDLFDQDTVYMNETATTFMVLSSVYIPPSIGRSKALRSFKPDGVVFGVEFEEIEFTNCGEIRDILEDYFVKRLGRENFERTKKNTRCLTDGRMNGDPL